jgi:hypothetical protein
VTGGSDGRESTVAGCGENGGWWARVCVSTRTAGLANWTPSQKQTLILASTDLPHTHSHTLRNETPQHRNSGVREVDAGAAVHHPLRPHRARGACPPTYLPACLYFYLYFVFISGCLFVCICVCAPTTTCKRRMPTHYIHYRLPHFRRPSRRRRARRPPTSQRRSPANSG